MPSEVAQKKNEINTEVKEMIDTNTVSKENNFKPTKANIDSLKTDESKKLEHSELNKAGDEVEIIEKSNGSEKISETENKESSLEDKEILKERAEKLLFEGKRHLIIKDYQAGVDVLSEACSLFCTVFGEMAEESAEAYFNYGCALLELSKDQTSPVGLEEKDEDSIQEESVSEVNVSHDKENATVSEKNTEVDEKSTENEEVNTSTDKKKLDDEVEDKSTEKEETCADEENPDEDENRGEEDIEEDDVNDLQVAWEMLDLAKVIYKNKDTEESKLKLAEVLIKCGEVSIEEEQFDTAIEDMTESLQIRRLLLPEDSRIIAETLFQLGIAQEMSGSGTQAIESFTEAVAVMEQRIKTLQNLPDDKANKEVAEIKTIIPEIKEKIVDIKDRKQATMCALMAAMGAAGSESANGSSSSTTKQVSNISHLVRKRPKQEDSNGAIATKVPKLEESTVAKQQ